MFNTQVLEGTQFNNFCIILITFLKYLKPDEFNTVFKASLNVGGGLLHILITNNICSSLSLFWKRKHWLDN